jgi:hypothetical protein
MRDASVVGFIPRNSAAPPAPETFPRKQRAAPQAAVAEPELARVSA